MATRRRDSTAIRNIKLAVAQAAPIIIVLAFDPDHACTKYM